MSDFLKKTGARLFLSLVMLVLCQGLALSQQDSKILDGAKERLTEEDSAQAPKAKESQPKIIESQLKGKKLNVDVNLNLPEDEDPLQMRGNADITPYPERNRNTGDLRRLTLQDCVKLALDRNARLRAAGYDIEIAQAQLEQAEAQFWPVFEYNYKAAPVPTDVRNALKTFFDGQLTLFQSIHVGIGVPLSTFGQLSKARKMAKGGIEAAGISETKMRETTIFQIKQLYYGILLAKETEKLLADAIQKIDEKVTDEENKDEKEMDPYDILQLKGTKVDLERRLEETQSNLALAYEGLRVQMDLEPDVELALDTDNLVPVLKSLGSEKEYIENALKDHSDLKLIDIGVETKRLQYQLEKFKLMPDAGFGFFIDVGRTVGDVRNVQLTDDYNDPFNYTRAGAGLQIKGNIDFHGAAARIKKARAEYYKASFEKLIARRGINLEVRKAYLNAKRLQEDLNRAKRAESIARQMTFLSKLNVDMGIGENQRYGDALKYLLLARGLYFKAVFDYNVAMADLSQKIGQAKYDKITRRISQEEFESIGSGEDLGFQTYQDNATTYRGVNDGEFSRSITIKGAQDAE